MPQGVEVQVLSWAPANQKSHASAIFDLLGAQEETVWDTVSRGLEKVASYFEKIATTYTDSVRIKSSPPYTINFCHPTLKNKEIKAKVIADNHVP